jgi:hypothetical protein
MSSVWGTLFGNRPTPANDAHYRSNHYEPDNETSEAWDASSNGWGHGHRRGGDPCPPCFQMIARTFDSKLAEPLLPAEPAPDALLRFGPRARRDAGEPLLKRSTPAAVSPASPEFVQSYASSATEEPGLPHRAGPWRLAGWGVLGVGAPSLVAVAIVMLSPALRPPTPLESTDQATHPRAPSAAPAIPGADMTTALPGEPRAPLQIGEAAAPVRPDFKEGMAVPPSAIAVSPAPPPATSPIPTLASETEADAERFIAEVERKMDALSAEVGRKMDALSTEMDALFAEAGRLEGHQDSTSPEQATPLASPPPAVAVSPAPPPATSPVLPLVSEAAADADRPVAAVERERDAMAAEVGRLQSHRDSTSPEPATPLASPPPAVAALPAPPPATSPVLPLASEAAADADRPVAAVERESDAMAAEVGRLQSHRDSTSPEPATPLASPPPAVAVSPVAPPATSPVLPPASEAAAERESDALFAEVDRLQSHRDLTSPEPATPLASPPPAVTPSPVAPPTSSPVAPLASSPVLPAASEAAADADRPVAAVERKIDAMAAEVGRLEGHQDSTSPEQATPPAPPPPAFAVSPVAPPATSPVLPPASEAAADAVRRIAAVERKMDALSAEVDRLQSHRDSTSPEQNKPPASSPAVAVSPVVREDARPAPSVVHAGVADLTSDETCRRDGDRLARLRASPSGEETQRFASELGCEALRPQLQRLMESLGLVAPVPPSADGSNGSSSDPQAAREDARPAPPVVHAGVADLTSDETCRRDGDRLARLRASPSGEETQRFASELGCEALRPQLQRLMESLGLVAPVPPSADGSNGSSSDAQAAPEDARPASPVVHAGVADLTSDGSCRRDGDRLARLRASPSGEETQRFASELGCEALRPQLQRLMERLGLVAPVPPSASNSTASSDSVLAQVCASERAALDRLRKEPSAEAARLFWRDLKCARLRPQVRLLMDSLNATPRPLGSAAEPGEADSRRAVTIDAPTANGTDSMACRRETPELHRIRATLDLGDANRFASAVTCDALKPQAARLLESLKG